MTTMKADPIRFGHIAGALREFMDQQGWKVPQLNEAIGLAPASVAPYNWLAAKGGIRPLFHKKLSKLTGLPIETWQPRSKRQPTIINGHDMPIAPTTPTSSRVAEIMSVNFSNDGKGRIRLDVTLPASEAMKIAKALFDCELVPASENADG